MKVLFMGTPAFAVPALNAISASDRHTVVGVVTQPDRALRHGKAEEGAVKLAARSAWLDVFQPARIRDDVEKLRSFGADIAVTAAYGQLLTQSVLDAFPRGVINIHASLLPKYRGASPIQSAVINGDRETGVTIMQTELSLDTGDILGVKRTAIGEDETGGELTARLSQLGAELLIEVLDGYDGISPVKQDDSKATYCRTIKKAEEYIDFSLDAQRVKDHIRALSPAPCAKTVICGETFKLYAADVCDASGRPGEILESKDRLVIACGSGAIVVKELQAPGKRAMPAADFLRGRRLPIGDICAKA